MSGSRPPCAPLLRVDVHLRFDRNITAGNEPRILKSCVMGLGGGRVSKLVRCLEVRKPACVVSRPLSGQTRHIPEEDRKSQVEQNTTTRKVGKKVAQFSQWVGLLLLLRLVWSGPGGV